MFGFGAKNGFGFGVTSGYGFAGGGGGVTTHTFEYDSTSTNQLYYFTSPVGTSLTLNGVVYQGADDISVGIPSSDSHLTFTETPDGCLTYFSLIGNLITGSIHDISHNVNMNYFNCNSNQLTGSIPDLSANTLLNYFNCNSNQLTGSIPDLSANTLLNYFNCNSNQLTGSIPDLSANTALEEIDIGANQLTGFAGGSLPASLYSFSATDNNLSVQAVDDILQACVNAGVIGATISLEGGTNGIPSSAGLANKAILEGNGCTVTTKLKRIR